MVDTIYWLIFAIPAIILASTFHEYAHAWVANKLGDPTARAEGRLTLNPLAHIDPIGAIMMIVAQFGWSKPVPISEYNFDNPVRGTAITAIAGPISNLLLTIIIWLTYKVLVFSLPITPITELVFTFLIVFYVVNISLMIFNLLPIPPLDGHKIVRALLPTKLRYSWEMLEKYSVIIILIFVLPFSPLSQITRTIISSTISFFLSLL